MGRPNAVCRGVCSAHTMLKINLDWLPTLKNQECPISLKKLEKTRWHQAGLGLTLGLPSEGVCVLGSAVPLQQLHSFVTYLVLGDIPSASSLLKSKMDFFFLQT